MYDGRQYPMEMHIVHINADYRNFTRAVSHDDGLLVLSFVFEVNRNLEQRKEENRRRTVFIIFYGKFLKVPFFKLSETNNTAMTALVDSLAKVVSPGVEEQIEQNITIAQLMPDSGFDKEFYQYQVC